MFDRVKAYIIISFLTSSGIAAACLFFNGSFRSQSYDTVTSLASFEVWGVLYLLVAAGNIVALLNKSVMLARIVGSLSITLMATWAAGFVVEVLQGDAHGPTAFIMWLSICAKDIVILSTPVITPLEEYLSNKYPDE